MSQTTSTGTEIDPETALAPETKNGKALREPEYHPRHSKYHTPLDIRPERVFSAVIQRDNSLCANCYADRWDYEAVDFRCGELGWLHWERRYPIPGRNDPDLAKGERHDGRPLCCTSCGFETGQRDDELSKPEVMAYTENLADALSLRGYPFDRETLRRAVWKLASEPSNQGKRGDIFGEAVTEAVRYARHQRQRRQE